MKIYAIRHGQTDLNAKGRIQGKGSDLPLNDEGKKQAREAAEKLKGLGIDLIAASPMKRALETAAIIADSIGIDQNDIIKCTRLYERDFGDYEGRLMSEVDMNALRRWTDNAPTPNGETIRDVASRVFDFMDRGLATLEEKIVKVLFVVHGHVLRTMNWYFNGLPEDGNETVIETDNCGIYEFDTEKIPQKMRGYQIVLDRKMLEDRLKRLSKSPYKASYSTCFAMCYIPGDYEVTFKNYTCPVCGKKTKHNSDYICDLNYAKQEIDSITKGRLKVDAVIDEREFCRHCGRKTVKHPLPILKIRFSSDEKYHKVRTGDYYDYKCLATFLSCLDEYKGKTDTPMFDTYHPLIDKIDLIVNMTGLCPEIVDEWKAWVAKHNKADKSGDSKDEEA